MKKKLNASPETIAATPAATGPGPGRGERRQQHDQRDRADVLVACGTAGAEHADDEQHARTAARLAARRCSSASGDARCGAGLADQGCSRSSARLSSSTLTRVVPSSPMVGDCSGRARGPAPRRGSSPRALATRSTCTSAPSREMSGSSPEADAVTRSTGTGPAATPSAVATAASRSSTASARSASSGRGSMPPSRWRCSRPRTAGDGSTSALVKPWASSARADDGAVADDQRALRLVVERDLRDRPDDEREDAAQRAPSARAARRSIGGCREPCQYPTTERRMSISLMPMNGAITPPTP